MPRSLGPMVLFAVLATACGGGGVSGDEEVEQVERVVPVEAEVVTVAYGDHPSAFADLHLPARSSGNELGVVVLVHGGFWRDQFGLSLMAPLAEDLVARGYAVWNIEYRRVGADGGGWPTTLDDVAAAMDELVSLAEPYGLDLDRVAVVGHSAGGHLAHWLATRDQLPADAPWAEPAVMPALVVGQAPVVNLELAATEGAGAGAVQAFLGGGPDDVPERYDLATPAVEVQAEMLIVHGDQDLIVVPRWATVGPSYDQALMLFEGADHFSVIDPAHESWAASVEAIDRVIGG